MDKQAIIDRIVIKSLGILDAIERASRPDATIDAFRREVAELGSSGNLKKNKRMYKELVEWAADLPASKKSELCEALGENIFQNSAVKYSEIEPAMAAGKISTRSEFLKLLKYVEQNFEEKSQAGLIERINHLLADYESNARK